MVSPNDTLKNIFMRDKKYSYLIPKYQRGYSWDSEQISEFWSDLVSIDNDDKRESETHFFGTIYTSIENPTKKRIIDGQQRITTSAIFLICVRDYFYMLKDKHPIAERFYHVMQEILYAADEQLRPNTNKFLLTLSRTNQEFFHKYIIPEKKPDATSDFLKKANNDSNEHLAKAYKQFVKLLDEKISKDESGAMDLNHMVWSLLDGFTFTEMEVSSDVQAYRMFNLINNRGIRLAESDLIKSQLFGILDENLDHSADDYESKLNTYDQNWADLQTNVTGQHYGDYDLDSFIHDYLIMTGSENVSLKNIYKIFKESVGSKESNKKSEDNKEPDEIFKESVGSKESNKKSEDNKEPDKILNALLDLSETFVILRNPDNSFEKYDDTIHYLKKIKNLNTSYMYPVLMAGYDHYWNKNNKKTFDKLVEICFKYHIRSNKSLGMGITREIYQNKLYKIMKIIQGEDPSLKNIINEITKDEKSYLPDDKLELQLKTLKTTNSNLAIALLEEIEKTYDDREKTSGSNVSVEHIMPKSIIHWKSYILEKHTNSYSDLNDAEKIKIISEKNMNLLGNLTLMSGLKNIKTSNNLFDEKKEIYKKSGYCITKELAKETEWTESTIKARQTRFQRKLLEILDLKKLDI